VHGARTVGDARTARDVSPVRANITRVHSLSSLFFLAFALGVSETHLTHPSTKHSEIRNKITYTCTCTCTCTCACTCTCT
jgi:hypothetical protein